MTDSTSEIALTSAADDIATAEVLPTFDELGLSPELLRAVSESGYTRPTPIQAKAIPTILMGRDVLGCAQTGTGKTAGFTLPMIDILDSGRARARMPRSLILCPTRELAAQVADNFDKYGKYSKLTKALIIGGEGMAEQTALLDRGVDVLIATPGRLLDMFERGRILLNDVKILVIDEADRMLDMGFIPDVERIVTLLPKSRQTLFFSATIAPEITKLADSFLQNPKEIKVSPNTTAAVTVEQFMAVVDEINKRETLRHILRLEKFKNAFVFCNRKRDVGVLYRSLTKHGFRAVQMHGDMSQPERTEALIKFKTGEADLMVCSDVAARGLDIKAVSHVFNFDVPIHAEDYIHRIGRTGRAGEHGRAFSIATPRDGKVVLAIEKLLGEAIPRMELEGVPPLEFSDEDDRGNRRSGRRGRNDRNGKKNEREKAPEKRVETAPASSDEPPVAPAPAAREAQDGRRDRNNNRRNDNVRGDHQRNDTQRGDGQRGDGRADRYRRRGRIDEYGIGEMTHADNAVGFGDHVPDFMLREARPSAPLTADEEE